MSRSRVEKVHCPNCDAENHILIWESLNTKLNPKETKQLLDGTFFVFECNQCNYKTLMDYAILYHDMENMCMIYYVGDDQIDKTKGIFEYAKKIGDPEYNKCYRHRMITIYKRCLEEPEIHSWLRRMPSGKKKLVAKRIPHFPSVDEHIQNGDIMIDKECKNAFCKGYSFDYIAYRLLVHIFVNYQKKGELPEKDSFIQ